MRATSLDFAMLAFFLCLALIAVCVLFHYETLRLLNDSLARSKIFTTRAKVLAALVGAMASHVLQISVFRLAYYFLRDKFGMEGSAELFRTR